MSDDQSPSTTPPSESAPTPVTCAIDRTETDSSKQALTRHDVYYLDPVVFRVEGVLFKVPKYGFMVPGSMFYDMFSLPIPDGEQAQGSSDSNPIELPSGVTQQDFFGFLFLLYPFFEQAYSEIHYEELVGALKLGTMWQFAKIQHLAVRLLSTMLKYRHPVETVLLAKQYHLKNVLRQGYMALIDRYITIKSLRVPHQLDWETISKIFAAQAHSMHKVTSLEACPFDGSSGTYEPYRIDLDISPDVPLDIYIDTVFAEEFSYMQSMEDESDVDVEELERDFRSHVAGLKHNATGTQTNLASPNASLAIDDISLISTTILDRKHHIYYIDMISLRVNNVLFCVPKNTLTALCEPLLFLDKEQSKSRKGGYVLLPGVTQHSFARFLWTILPINNLPLRYTYDEWVDVLYLSSLWGMKEVRQRAVAELTPLMNGRPHLEAVLMGRKYHVKNWMFDGLVGLVIQNPPFTIQTLRELNLDWETIAKLFAIREQSFEHPPLRTKIRCSWCNRNGGIKLRKGSCEYSCINLKLQHQDPYEVDKELKAHDSAAFNRSIDPETARSLVETEFGSETVYW